MRVPRRIGIFPLILFYLKIDNICTLVLLDASMRHDAFIRVQYSIDIPRCISVVRFVDIFTHGPVSASASRVSLIVSNQPALRLSTDFLSPVQLTVD